MEGHKSQVTDYKSQVTSRRLQVTSHRLQRKGSFWVASFLLIIDSRIIYIFNQVVAVKHQASFIAVVPQTSFMDIK